LTQTARTVFRQLVEFQLSDHPGGLPFSALFTVCREQLILSNEITLRSHLEEFIDHDLCCMNDSSESVGLYKIPLRTNDIQSLIDNVLQ
jgi:origin recognition complex subunit 2